MEVYRWFAHLYLEYQSSASLSMLIDRCCLLNLVLRVGFEPTYPRDTTRLKLVGTYQLAYRSIFELTLWCKFDKYLYDENEIETDYD